MNRMKKFYYRVSGYNRMLFHNDIQLLHQAQLMLDVKRELVWKNIDSSNDFEKVGFQAFSQSDEDGIIQFLINNIKIKNKTFIEFGVEDYSECNTKFLLLNNRWSGFIMDGSKEAMEEVKKAWYYWKYDIKTKDVFITRDNINSLLEESGFDADVGLLSIDIDGVDYWVWERIETISPAIVVTEINPIFGSKHCISVPYDAEFNRTDKHYSNLYWGMSLGAASYLGEKKGYSLVCMNQLGHNAFFVRNDLLGNIKKVSPEEVYKPLSYRESKNEDGTFSYMSMKDGLKLIGDLDVVDVITGKVEKIGDLDIV